MGNMAFISHIALIYEEESSGDSLLSKKHQTPVQSNAFGVAEHIQLLM